MNQEWMESAEFKGLPPMKQALLKALITEGAGKKPEELLHAFLKANSELNNRGMNFTNKETSLLMTAFMESMSPAEQKNFKMMQQLMQMNQK